MKIISRSLISCRKLNLFCFLFISFVFLRLLSTSIDRSLIDSDNDSISNFENLSQYLGESCERTLMSIAKSLQTEDFIAHRNYFPVFSKFLCPWRIENRRVTLLEFGVGGYANPWSGGKSLMLWSRFFEDSSVIIGVDIKTKFLKLPKNVYILKMSATDENMRKRICEPHGPFDLIIDDASHLSEDVIKTFELTWECLKTDGLYIVKDTQTSYFEQYHGSLDLINGKTSMNYFKKLLDEQNFAEIKYAKPDFIPKPMAKEIQGMHFYHNLIVIEKGSNEYPTNMG